MAALVEGHQYGLSSCEKHSANLTVVYVKLTDSALKAIKEYQRISATTSRLPKIQLSDTRGVLSFPNAVSSSSPEGYHSFDFTLSSLQSEGPQGNFECVEQKQNDCLKSLGSMQHKILVQAKEDVYQTTKEKMTLVEEESKKNSTKVIKASGPYVGRKVKMKKPGAIIPPKTTNISPHSAIVNKGNSHKPHSLNSNNIVTHNVGPLSTQNFNSVNKPSNNIKSVNSEVKKKSYRDRIIHLIAVRPYKKPELLTRLMKDGIKDKDKNSLSAILHQVATLKDNTYNLAKHMYAEVQSDWPFYTDIDRELLKRRMPQSDSSPPNSHHGSGSPAPVLTSQKGPNNPACSPTPPKKQRISHYNNKTSELKSDSNGFVHNSVNNNNNNSSSPLEKCENPSPEAASHEIHSQVSKNCKDSASPYPDYLSKYVPISSYEQRQRYKQDFNAEYDEYRELYSNVQKVTNTFIALEDSLRKAEEGSEESHKIQLQILSEYQENVQDPKYVDQRKRLQYLQDKLAHIKRLVLDYDHAVS